MSDAIVTVSDDLNQVYTFEESETEPGLYIARFQGEVGRTYTLQVTLPTEEVLTATEALEATVSGRGSIQYRGNPASVDTSISGSRNVSKG